MPDSQQSPDSQDFDTTATRVRRKGFDTSIVLFGPGSLMASGRTTRPPGVAVVLECRQGLLGYPTKE